MDIQRYPYPPRDYFRDLPRTGSRPMPKGTTAPRSPAPPAAASRRGRSRTAPRLIKRIVSLTAPQDALLVQDAQRFGISVSDALRRALDEWRAGRAEPDAAGGQGRAK